MADDTSIREHISELVAEEHELRRKLAQREISAEEEHARLRHLEAELDQCWDLLRQRDARREFGENPDEAALRSEDVVEKYLG
jgi:predicted nuclease with TOPRIM domain